MTTVSLSALLEKIGTAAFVWEGERVEFAFYAGEFTAALQTDLAACDEVYLAAWMAEKALAGWNLADGNGNPVPITVEATAALPAALKRMFLQAMGRWQTPTESESCRPGCTARQPGRTGLAMPASCPAAGTSC